MKKPPKFLSNFLQWPVDRSNRTFRAFVVEPELYEPAGHGDIFDAALNSLIVPQPALVDEFQISNSPTHLEQFDLLTFPEAFLPSARLLLALDLVGQSGLAGCVHVGLRPSADEPGHLFSVPALWALIEGLKTLEDLNTSDLVPFTNWLENQPVELNFNVGCLFTIDSERKVRVCLHPKLVRSKFEFSGLVEEHMEEANLLTVVTLRPVDKTFLTITIQPLLCSDVLHLKTDRSGSRPLEAIHKDAECLGETPPDHVDIVSVATCTPQVEELSAKSEYYRTWHDEFRDSFRRAANDDGLARHHLAAFVLSNFRKVPKDLAGGLSGAFIPIIPEGTLPDFVNVSQWGKYSNQGSNRWSTPDDDAAKWSGRCYIASLSPSSDGAGGVARMFGFTLLQLPRHMSRWQSKLGLAKCAVKIAEPSAAVPPLTFVVR